MDFFLKSRFPGNLFSRNRVFVPHGWQLLSAIYGPIFLLFFCFNRKIDLFQMTKNIRILKKRKYKKIFLKKIPFFNKNFDQKKLTCILSFSSFGREISYNQNKKQDRSRRCQYIKSFDICFAFFHPFTPSISLS